MKRSWRYFEYIKKYSTFRESLRLSFFLWKKWMMKRTGLKYKFLIFGALALVLVVISGLAGYGYWTAVYPDKTYLLLTLLAVYFIISGLLTLFLFAKIMIKPVVELTEKMDRIRRGDWDVAPEVPSEGQFLDEMDLLYSGFAHMVETLDNNFRQLNEAKEQAEKFSAELKKSTSRLEAIFDGISDGIMIIDHDFKIVAHNKKMKDILGYAKENIVGETCYEMCTGGPNRCAFCNARRVFESGQPIYTYCTKDDKQSCEEKVFELHNFPLYNSDGQINQIIEYVKDVTDATRMRSSLEHAQRLADIGTMAGKVAHEVRNPLNAIKGAAHYLKGEIDDPDAGEYLKLIEEQVERVNNVTTQLLSLTKPMLPVLQPGDVRDVVDKALQVVRPQLMSGKVNVIYKAPDHLPNMIINDGQLQQAMINIFLNAIEAMEESKQPTLHIYYRLHEQIERPFMEIVVEDNGGGLEKVAFDKMLKPFFTTKAKGTGLGLTIVQRIVDNHHGYFSLKSREDGTGTRAVIRLPIGGGDT